MRARGAGRPLLAALAAVAGLAAPVTGGTLSVEGPEGVILEIAMPEGGEWCLRWNHSVTGGAVADCFGNEDGTMVLRRSYLHDFAAGLGEVPGRGRTVPAPGGGYWIEGIDEPVAGDTLPLRVGRRRVDHRITVGRTTHDLSERAAGQRVLLRLTE